MFGAYVRLWRISEAHRAFLENLRDVVHSFLLLCVHDFCVNLSRFQLAVSEKFAHCVDVRAEGQHQHCECVSPDMERYALVNSCSQCPNTEAVIGLAGIAYISEHMVAWFRLPTFANQLCCLWCDVKIFLSSGFLLSEYQPGPSFKFRDLSPREPSQCRSDADL